MTETTHPPAALSAMEVEHEALRREIDREVARKYQCLNRIAEAAEALDAGGSWFAREGIADVFADIRDALLFDERK